MAVLALLAAFALDKIRQMVERRTEVINVRERFSTRPGFARGWGRFRPKQGSLFLAGPFRLVDNLHHEVG